MRKDLPTAVIGAGPAGVTAAISLSEAGGHAVVFEHQDSALQKLLLTGNGKCNFTNSDVSPKHYHGDTGFIQQVLSQFGTAEMIRFMDHLGVEAAGKRYRFDPFVYYYPSTFSAGTVREALLRKAEELSVEFHYRSEISDIERSPDGFRIHYVQEGRSHIMEAGSVIIAAGSNAAPATGSDSSFYPVLKRMNIGFRTFYPALCAIRTGKSDLSGWKGIRADCSVRLIDCTDELIYQTADGEVQFSEHKVSGIPVMQLSGFASSGIRKKHEMNLSLEILKINNKNSAPPERLLQLPVTGTDGFEKAQCCGGGVETGEVSGMSLMSFRHPGIFFAGEILDIDGECGGFNLHFAFATGWIAGRSAFSYLTGEQDIL